MIPVIAHGLGDAALLPIPLPFVLVGAGGAVLGLGTALARRDAVPGTHGPRTPTAVGWTLPRWVTALVDAPVTRVGLRALTLLAAGLVLALAALGPPDAAANPAPRLVLVVLWGGLVPLSLLAPGAWRTVHPLRTLSAGLAHLSGDPEERGARALPEGLGWWPAAAALAVFAVVEGPLRNDLPVLLGFLVLYALVQSGLAAVYGSRWYARGDIFEVLAAVVGRLSPVRRGADGRLRLGSPMPRLQAPMPPGALLVAGILIGSALADFAAETPAWGSLTLGRSGGERILLETAALVTCCTLATGVLRIGASARPLAPALLPPVTGYLFAHYFAVLLIEGQATLSQLAALPGGGWRTLTTADLVARYDLLPGPLAATLQLAGFLLPHLVAVVVGHRLAVAAYGPRRARAAQAPLLGVLALSAVVGVALRYSAA